MSDAHHTRRDLLWRALSLETFIVAYNILEGLVAFGAGLLSNSVSLVSFGIDSFIEVTSAIFVLRQVRSELGGRTNKVELERLERKTAKVAGILLWALAFYIVIDSGRHLLAQAEESLASPVGIAMTALSLVIMPVVGWMKLRIAAGLGSGALRADSFQTVTCAWLSLTLLIGLAMNAAFGWAWADPLAALIAVPLVVREGWNALQGRSCQTCHIDFSNARDQQSPSQTGV